MKKTNVRLIGAATGGVALGMLLSLLFKNFSFYLPRKPPVSRKPYPEQPAGVFSPIDSRYLVTY